MGFYTIGKQNRTLELEENSRNNPGPGSYELKTMDKSVEFRFRSEKKIRKDQNGVPGVGEYEPKGIMGSKYQYQFKKAERMVNIREKGNK